MLISVNGISTKERANIVNLSITCCDRYGVIKLTGQLLPFLHSTCSIDFAAIVLFIRNGDHIAVIVRHTVTSDQQRAKMQLHCELLLCTFFCDEGTKIDLEGLPNLLLKTHSYCNAVSLVIVLLVYGLLCHN